MKEYKIPKFLHEVHGEYSSLRDLLFVYFFAVVVTVLNYLLIKDLNLPLWKLILYLIVVFDISGGVPANFTYSTNKFYNENTNKRLGFLSLHVLQPAVILLAFSSEYYLIIILSVYTLISSFIVNYIKDINLQKVAGILLTAIGFIALNFINSQIISLNIVLQLFMLKLILAFSVKWN